MNRICVWSKNRHQLNTKLACLKETILLAGCLGRFVHLCFPNRITLTMVYFIGSFSAYTLLLA